MVLLFQGTCAGNLVPVTLMLRDDVTGESRGLVILMIRDNVTGERWSLVGCD